jgi:hypothetical protein
MFIFHIALAILVLQCAMLSLRSVPSCDVIVNLQHVIYWCDTHFKCGARTFLQHAVYLCSVLCCCDAHCNCAARRLLL